ncbi:hypothetical protein [Roseimicrobium sp. ORNL1]|uniref:hypothetical protein n=1 Tax=Roseimicrobium sp. ORNL1 TaxID=2711231 RepID=UPI0013E19980|nr:hypothetical protein [Roseimicrobium sp. ORNL1]QIF05693.1 hypothetical protein G5S37_30735 [Roseimicrobium sp. ORNL1]
MKIRNALQEDAPVPPLTPQILPAKAACHDHTLNLTRVVRSRVASQLTGGLRFEMNVDGHEPAHRRYSFYEWLIEDSKSNIAYWPKSTPSGGAEVVGRALWNDSQVWRVRFRALRNLDSDYTPAEKVTFQRVPVPVEGLETTPTEPYHEVLTLLGRKVRLDDVQSEGTSAVSFRVTISPRMEKQVLVMLHAADAQGNGGLPVSDHAATHREPLELVGFVDNHPDNGLIYKGRVPRPLPGNHLTVTFGADEGVPLEFTFRPEFEP